MASQEDEDDDEYEALYADGRWIWDDEKNQLKFISDIDIGSQSTTIQPPAVILGPVQFKEELDVIEQQRFRKRIQRRVAGPNDIVMLQDVKDLVIYLAPMTLLTHTVIKVFHTTTTERFLRALILYCQYYLQTLEVMERRTVELQSKIPTENSKAIELQYQENLNDLRLLVAKEYCTMLLGADDFRKYHHKGMDKKLKSLSRKEALIFEPLIRISVQIVWIALARRQYTQIELEINRLFRSKKFNLVEHNLKLDLDQTMTPNQRLVMRGQCLSSVHTLHVHSPFFNEVECERYVDFKMLGLGTIKYPKLSERLSLLEALLIMPERKFPDHNLNLGIIGLQRDMFDPMLREIQRTAPDSGDKQASTIVSAKSLSKRMSKSSTQSKKSTTSVWETKYYPNIYLPTSSMESQPTEFITENQARMAVNMAQQKKWLALIAQRNRRKSRRT